MLCPEESSLWGVRPAEARKRRVKWDKEIPKTAAISPTSSAQSRWPWIYSSTRRSIVSGSPR
jgi:hypothetical protein